MGKKSNTKRKNTNVRKKTSARSSKKRISTELMGGISVVLGLLLFVFFTFVNVGSLAEGISEIFKGLFSYTAYVFPLVLVITGIMMIVSEKNMKFSSEVLKGLIFMTFFSALLFSFVEKDYNLYNNFIQYVSNAYNDSIDFSNISGAVGSVIASVIINLIGVVGARILLIFLTLIAIMYYLRISIKQLISAISSFFLFISDGLKSVYNTLFAKEEHDEDEEDEEDEEYIKKFDLDKDGKLSRTERRRAKEEKMKEKGNVNVESNLKVDKAEQIEFDFNKLGGKPSESELQAKQQRDEFFKKEREQKEDKTIKEVLTLDHTKLYEDQNYVFPPIDLLGKQKSKDGTIDKRSIHATAVKLQKTLASFGVEAKVTNITKGPTVTRYELTPSTGVKVSRIVNLADDIALNLAAKSIRIEAPIPGKAAVGIEVPNTMPESVLLREVVESDTFKNHPSNVAFSLGKDAAGETVVGDIAKMPHVLIAGSTGSGKSVCINSLIVSILYKSKPSDVKLILVDPKMVELSGYNGIPHLLIPVVTDPKKAAGALNWAVQEMVRRYNLFASHGVKDIKGYNKAIETELDGVKMPQIVIIIDELADLMMVAPNDVEDAICRLAQMARAAGMHLVVATQRPSVDVITGIIKANIPSRIAFTVSSQVDSRTILDMAGAEKLLGKGDMLYFPVGESKPHRIQGAFISEKEIEDIVSYIKQNSNATYSEDIIESIEKSNDKTKGSSDEDESDADPILTDAIDLVVDMGQASASMLQRRFKIGYSRAGRIIDQMEQRGLISGYEGSKPRQVLVSKAEWQELKLGNNEENTSSEDITSEETVQNS